MIPRAQRLNDRRAQAALRAKGKAIRTRFFVLYIRPASHWRLGVNVSGKTARKATERNKIRRAAQAALLKHRIPGRSHEVLAVAQKEALSQTGASLQEDIYKALQKHA